MKNLILFLAIILAFESANAQKKNKLAQDTIRWKKESSLVKENFKAKHPVGKALATTYSGLYFHSEPKGGSLMFYVEAIFSKSKSYMKDDSPYILKHEQIHFDITELYARKFRQAIIDKDFTKVKNISETMQKIANKIVKEWQKEENKYDNDTEHGFNAAKQKLWNEKIEKRLAESEIYSSAGIDIANK
jgi:hypothetical protein